MKVKILVIDNEAPIRTALCKMLLHFGQETYLLEEATGVKDGLDKVERFDPDIIFLDIEMDDGTGFDLLNALPKPRFQLVFTTAHNQYAIQAFDYSAINYLLKPVSPSALQRTLQRAIENIRQQKDWQQQYQLLVETLSQKNEAEQKIALRDNNGTYFIHVRDILFCEADGPYTRFKIRAAHDIVVSKNLREYERLLDPYGFIRCHHGFLVNAANINRYDKNEMVLLTADGFKVPISTRKKEAVLEALEQRK